MNRYADNRTQSAPPRQNIQQRPAYSPEATLIQIANGLKLTDSALRFQIENVLRSGNPNLVAKMLSWLTPHYLAHMFNPDQFISYAENLGGAVGVGHLKDGRALGVDEQDLVRHIGIFGQSGTGKSTVMRNLVLQGLHKREYAQFVFDQEDDFSDMVRQGADVIHWSMARDNFLQPPQGIDIREYINFVSTVSGEEMRLQDLGTSVNHDAVYSTYEGFGVLDRWPAWDWEAMRFPTMLDLYDTLASPDFAKRHKGRGVDSRYSIMDKLFRGNRELRPLICQRGFSIEQFIRDRRTVIYQLSGLSRSAKTLWIMMTVLKILLFLKANFGRGGCHALVFLDEAKSLLGVDRSNFMLTEFISVARDPGLGLVVADQIPSQICQAAYSNLGTEICFRLSDWNDVRRVGLSMGASPEQIAQNFSLQIGEALVRTMKSKDIQRIRIPVLKEKETTSMEEVSRLMEPRLRELNEHVIPVVSAAPNVREASARNEGAQPAEEQFTSEETEFLRAVARDCGRPVSKVYEELGLSASAGHRMKERLRKRGFLTQIETNLGKGGKRAVFVVPNPDACSQVGIELGEGRGGALHRHFQQLFKDYAEKRGHTAVIEECLGGTPEGPDVGVTLNTGERIAVEIAITSKPSQEIVHVEKNMRLGYGRVLLSFIHRSVLEKAKNLAVKKYGKDVLERVSFCMVADVQRLLMGGG